MKQEKIKETRVVDIGKDEIYCTLWKCLNCGFRRIQINSKYCSECGAKIISCLNEEE